MIIQMITDVSNYNLFSYSIITKIDPDAIWRIVTRSLPYMWFNLYVSTLILVIS